MSSPERPAFSLPTRAECSRTKERMEASLAGLCELELLRRRQESRVRSALCLGDSPAPRRLPRGAERPPRLALDAPAESAPRGRTPQTSHLQPCDAETCLEQQVAELKVSTEVSSLGFPDLDDICFSSDVLDAKPNQSPETSDHTLVPRSLSHPDGTGGTDMGHKWLSDLTRQVTLTDACGETRNVEPSQEDKQQAQKLDTYIFQLSQRGALPLRLSKPRPSWRHDPRGVGVIREINVCLREEGSIHEISDPSQCSEGADHKLDPEASHNLDQEPYLGPRSIGDSPTQYHRHLQKSAQPQSGRHHSQAALRNCSTLQDHQPFMVQETHPNSSNREPDSALHFYSFPSTTTLSKPHQTSPADEQLVNAEYIPAQPCRASSRAHVHAHCSPQKGSGIPKPSRTTCSTERGHHLQEQHSTVSQVQSSRFRGASKKSRLNEDKYGASRKQGRKACRSQSENSLRRVPEHKYNPVDRDCGESGIAGIGSHSIHSRSKKHQQGGSSHRRWQSTMELSQDEADQSATKCSSASNQKDNSGRRLRKCRPTRVSHAPPHHHSQLQKHMECQLEGVQVQPSLPTENYPQPAQGESESSTSEADSSESSSLSSDSDDGDLVWPQQLPPQHSLPSTPVPPGARLQPKAFVKIKASQALKKKILRFHTGSLKVMTTV